MSNIQASTPVYYLIPNVMPNMEHNYLAGNLSVTATQSSPEYCGSFIHREQTIRSFLLKGLNFFLFMEKGVVSNFFAIVYRKDENIYVVSSLASDKQIEVNLWSVRRRVQL